MFEEFAGIPVHPLLVHAAVVFVPLLAIGAIVYAVAPATRQRIRWAVALLTVVGAGSAVLARFSGVAFRARLVRRKLASPEILDKITGHEHYGNVTMWVTLGLAVVTLAYLWFVPGRTGSVATEVRTDAAASAAKARDRGAALPRLLLGVVVVVLAAVSLYYVYRTGDTGAHIVWSGY